MVQVSPSRRRFLSILGSATAAGLLPLTTPVLGQTPSGIIRWSGRAMGADASMALAGVDQDGAEAILSACEKEIGRLEDLFSLFRPGSTLSLLNRDGWVRGASPEFTDLIRTALKVASLTSGAFDPTVQPLWNLYADHFAQGGDPSGPSEAEKERARALVGYRMLKVAGDSVAYGKPGMAVTLNGIAQGYMTDRITSLLKSAGIGHVLVNMGEHKALGRHPDGSPWRVGIRNPESLFKTVEAVPLEDAAIATSGSYGTVFDRTGRFHHLFDPKTGESSARHASVSVQHRSATWADALSTAFSSMSEAAVADVISRQDGARALIVRRDGRIVRLA